MKYEDHQKILDCFRDIGIDKITYQTVKNGMDIQLTIPHEQSMSADILVEVLEEIISDYPISDYDINPTITVDGYVIYIHLFEEAKREMEIDSNIFYTDPVMNDKIHFGKDYNEPITNIENMRFVKLKKHYKNLTLVKGDDNRLEKLQWEYSVITSNSTKKNKNGEIKKYPNYRVGFPMFLLEYFEAKDSIYLYEHFEKICIAWEKPPEEVSYKKVKLNNVITKNKLEEREGIPPKRITLPSKYWDITPTSTCYITYEPYKQDYITGLNGLITIDVIEEEAIEVPLPSL